MSACPTCESQLAQMPSRVVAIVDGVTYVQNINPSTRVQNLLDAARYLIGLADQGLDEMQPNVDQPANG